MASTSYGNLHVYLISGTLTELDGSMLDDTFIGNWQGVGLDTLRIGPFLVVPPWLENPEV